MLFVLGGLIVVAIGVVTVGIVQDMAARTAPERYTGEDLANYRSSRLMREGIHLCADCNNEYVPSVKGKDFCDVCEPTYEREERSWIDRHPVAAFGYRPIYMREGFEDFYTGEEK
jgi:hypothetical protein